MNDILAMDQSLPKLIFDIGAHKGDDTFFYLQFGYHVLAIEANPGLVAQLKQRFKKEIAAGELQIINCLIAAEDNQQHIFFLNSDSSKSSVYGSGDSIYVGTRTLASLIEENGIPFYCKVDIEGSDITAIRSLRIDTVPEYISVEISGNNLSDLLNNKDSLFTTIDQLHALGYKYYKLVDQESLSILDNRSFYIHKLQLGYRLKIKFLRFFFADNKTKILKRFGLNSEAELSGHFGEELEGKWFTYQESRKLINFHFQQYIKVNKNISHIFWVDIHAAKIVK